MIKEMFNDDQLNQLLVKSDVVIRKRNFVGVAATVIVDAPDWFQRRYVAM